MSIYSGRTLWILASIGGGAAGMALAGLLPYSALITAPVLSGVMASVAQWLVLRATFGSTRRWLVVTSIALVAGITPGHARPFSTRRHAVHQCNALSGRHRHCCGRAAAAQFAGYAGVNNHKARQRVLPRAPLNRSTFPSVPPHQLAERAVAAVSLFFLIQKGQLVLVEFLEPLIP